MLIAIVAGNLVGAVDRAAVLSLSDMLPNHATNFDRRPIGIVTLKEP